jgi:DNA-binding Lrp family transcriptional regulator
MDEVDKAIAARLVLNARLRAAAIARSTGEPKSTVRRRLNGLVERGQVVVQTVVDPKLLGSPLTRVTVGPFGS